jgi:hypothetical protein
LVGAELASADIATLRLREITFRSAAGKNPLLNLVVKRVARPSIASMLSLAIFVRGPTLARCLAERTTPAKNGLRGRNPLSWNRFQGRPKPLRSSFPNAQFFISNPQYLPPRKGLIFLGFWGLSKVNATFIWDILKQVGNPTF